MRSDDRGAIFQATLRGPGLIDFREAERTLSVRTLSSR